MEIFKNKITPKNHTRRKEEFELNRAEYSKGSCLPSSSYGHITQVMHQLCHYLKRKELSF